MTDLAFDNDRNLEKLAEMASRKSNLGESEEVFRSSGPTQSRSQALVAAISEAGAQVFAQLGFSGATTNKIAERAGVSIGSLYRYFVNKETLFQFLMNQIILNNREELTRFLDSLGHRPLTEKVDVTVDFAFDILMRKALFLRVLYSYVYGTGKAHLLKESRRRIAEVLAGYLREHHSHELIETDLVPPLETLVHAFTGVIQGLVFSSEQNLEIERGREELKRICQLHIKGLARPQGSR